MKKSTHPHITLVFGSVAPCLNSSVADGTVIWSEKTSDNNPEEALTPGEQGDRT